MNPLNLMIENGMLLLHNETFCFRMVSQAKQVKSGV